MKICLLVLVGYVYAASIQRVPQPVEQKVPETIAQGVLKDIGLEDQVGIQAGANIVGTSSTPNILYDCKLEFNRFHCQGCFYDYSKHMCCCAV